MCVCVYYVCEFMCLCVYIYIYIYIYILVYVYICKYVSEYVIMYIWMCLSIYIYIYIKLATIVEGNPKAPFSIATTPMCRGGRYSFPGSRAYLCVYIRK